MNKKQLYIELTISDNCNCNCAYCFEGKHPFVKPNLSIQNRLLELIVDTCKNFNNNIYDALTISFWGGEPFMDLPFINRIIQQTKDFKFVRYHCYSNGTLVETYKEFLKQDYIEAIRNRIHIQLSYDGEPHHTIKRGNNSSKVFEVADMLEAAKIHFNFKATLSYDMLEHLSEIWDSYEKVFERYGRNFTYYPTLDTCNSDINYLDIWKKQLIEVAKKEYKFYSKYHTFLFGWFLSTNRRVNCALENSIHIHSDGNIYICHGCAYKAKNDNFKIGNINKITSLYEVITDKYGIQEIPKQCLNCTSSHCQVCHIENIASDEDPYLNWISCRVNNKDKCRFFKEFGYISRLLKYTLVNKGIFYGRIWK